MRARVVGGILLLIVAVFFLAMSGKLYEYVDADEIVAIQHPLTGDITFHTTAGPVWQGFGEVTTYKKVGTYDFLKEGQGRDIRFSDGGHGKMYGKIQFELPMDKAKLAEMHSLYRTQDRVQTDIIQTATNNAIYLAGALMSSAESYAAKRPDLVRLILDQVQNGIYQTRQTTEWVTDDVTKERKQIVKAEIVMRDGQPLRQEGSTLARFSIRAFQFQIDRLPYAAEVEAQIKQQQQLAMDQQTAAAQARMAEQAAITNEANGRAEAAKTKWAQEAIKAREVTKAQQEKEVAETAAARDLNVQVTAAKRDKEVAETAAAQRFAVAQLDHKAAEETKAQQILLGQGESERKKLVIEADGALEQKLATYERVTPKVFEALKGTAMVPQFNMGGGSNSGANGTTAMDMINLLTVKVAKDLALDMTMSTQTPRATGQR